MDKYKKGDRLWDKTHADYKGITDGEKCVLINRNGATVMSSVYDLTLEEIHAGLNIDQSDNFPRLIHAESGRLYKLVYHAVCLNNGWEWYGFEVDDYNPDIIIGFVMGDENEWGYFSQAELRDVQKRDGVHVSITTDPKDFNELALPPGFHLRGGAEFGLNAPVITAINTKA